MTGKRLDHDRPYEIKCDCGRWVINDTYRINQHKKTKLHNRLVKNLTQQERELIKYCQDKFNHPKPLPDWLCPR